MAAPSVARERLSALLAGRSEPVVAFGDRYVPAASVFTGARRRVRRGVGSAGDGDGDQAMLERAVALVWNGELELPDVTGVRRGTLLTAMEWSDPAQCWADVGSHLLGGTILVVRATTGSPLEVAELIVRWRPDRSHLPVRLAHALRDTDAGRAAMAVLREYDTTVDERGRPSNALAG